MYDKYDGGKIYLGDEFPLNIVGCGIVFIIFPNCRVKGINEFLHILGLARNLLLVGNLNDAGV